MDIAALIMGASIASVAWIAFVPWTKLKQLQTAASIAPAEAPGAADAAAARDALLVRLDPEVDAAYARIAPSIAAGEAAENVIIERGGGTIVLDFDAAGHLLGVEIVGAEALLTPATREAARTSADAEET